MSITKLIFAIFFVAFVMITITFNIACIIYFVKCFRIKQCSNKSCYYKGFCEKYRTVWTKENKERINKLIKSFPICRTIETRQRKLDSFWDAHEDASVSTQLDPLALVFFRVSWVLALESVWKALKLPGIQIHLPECVLKNHHLIWQEGHHPLYAMRNSNHPSTRHKTFHPGALHPSLF